jgi:hypothetical protein
MGFLLGKNIDLFIKETSFVSYIFLVVNNKLTVLEQRNSYFIVIEVFCY